jgi:REP element-mobilizing transposase RayT
MTDRPRLIEHAFPLEQTSLDSVHEKNVRHGHISTLHIWPARRPLAACRAALIATLLPDPGTPEERQKLCERIGGKVIEKIEKKKMPNGRTIERVKEETKGGILHWLGSEPTSAGKKKQEEYRRKAKFYEEELEWFRQEIRKAYGGRAPRVLDPFAGGGAIPLEAMRLGCEVTAVDINPVAWFILKCTLEYPQKLAGKTHPLPDFILDDEEFMVAFYKAHPHLVGETKRTKKQAQEFRDDLFMKDKSDSERAPEADLAWHVRAWGKWVLERARRELAKFYPTYAHFEEVGQASRLPSDSSRLPANSVSDRLLSALESDALVPMFLNPVAPTEVTQRRLPHWRQEGVLYFVTFRLVDSLPQERVEQLRVEREAWLKAHAEPWSKEATKEYYHLFSDRVEDWLNAGHGECLLRDPGARKVVSDALRHFDGTRYDLGAWCVMPNHVHALVRPRPGHELSNILHSWKSFTAHEINKRLGRKGEVWQHEGYDHIVRNPQSLWRIEQYILNNPIGAGLGVDEFALSPLTEISVGSFTISGGRFATETVAPPLMRLVPLKNDGRTDIDALNAEFSEEYLADKRNPHWVAKPTVAYVWARTVT